MKDEISMISFICYILYEFYLVEVLINKTLLNAVLYGSDEFNDKINREILLRKIYYIKSTKRFVNFFLTSANPLTPFLNFLRPFAFNFVTYFHIYTSATINQNLYLLFVPSGCLGD